MIPATFHSFAATGLFEALGIDWQMLLFQIIGFLVLVWVMAKFVFPVLFKSVDAREAKIEESVKAATDAEKKARKTQEELTAMIASARKDAEEIVATARDEASATLTASEKKAKAQAEHIVAEAHDEIAKEVVAVKKALHNETLELVAEVARKVVGNSVDIKADETIIDEAIKGVSRT